MSMEAAAPQTPSEPFPVRYDVEYPESLNRWLVLVKWLLAIPHFLIVSALGQVLQVLVLIAFFTILFTKKWPEGMFKFAVGIMRWQANTYAYAGLLRDEYPPFSLDAGQYPLTLEIDYPESMSRWLIFVKWLLVIPNLIAFFFVAIAAFVVFIIAFFAILFTGKYPRNLFDFTVGAGRWGQRMNAYIYLMTDRYPPFSLK